MRAPITNKHLLEMMWGRFPEIMKRGTEQPAQREPVAWLRKSDLVELRACNYMRLGADSPSIWAPNAPDEPSPDMELVAVYASPPAQRTWVGLTNEEKLEAVKKFRDTPVALVFDIEAKLKERNQ